MIFPLRKITTIAFISAMGLNTCAQAKWSTPKHNISAKPTASAVKIEPHVVQVFSSVNATKAEGMKNTLAMHGYPAFVNVKTQQKQPFYQVQIGPFSSKNLANSAKTSIIKRYPKFSFFNDAILKIAYNK